MKRILTTILFVLIISVLFCSCNNDGNSFNPETIVSEETTINKIDENINNCLFYSVKVLPNGNYINFFINRNTDSVHFEYIQIINSENGKVEKTIDISKCEIINSDLRCLNNCFYIYGNKIYVYAYSGEFVKEINYPDDINIGFDYSDSVFAVSNDLKKMIYCSINETDEEDILDVKLLDLNTLDKKIIQNLNKAELDKPCLYNAFSFSKDDKIVMYKGQRYLKINDAKQCYGSIDLNTFDITSKFINKSYCLFNGNTEFIYDVGVDYGRSSSGKIIQYDIAENEEKNIKLENKNESQYIGLTDKENMFITMLPDESSKSISVRLYRGGEILKKAIIKFNSEQDFNLTDPSNFCYSSKSNCIYYNYTILDGENYAGEKFCVWEMK